MKEHLVTKDTIGGKVPDTRIAIFMMNNEHLLDLGLDKLSPGKLLENKFVIPVEGDRDVENDIFLGLELIRNNGNIETLPSLFKSLLIEAIGKWLLANGEIPAKERIQEILRIEVPKSSPESQPDIEYIKHIITSA